MRFVDTEAYVILLEVPDGEAVSVEAGDSMDLERFHAGERAMLQYQELTELSLVRPESNGATIDVQSRTRQFPEGIQIDRSITATAEIVAIAKDGSTVTVRGPHDVVRTLQVTAPANQERVAELKAGDKVAVTDVELMRVSVEE